MPQPTPGSTDPRHNPSYPQRVNLKQRPALQSLLSSWEKRIAEAQTQVATKPDRTSAERLLVQMSGARDQIADAVRRMPMEVGDLYAEDKHRLDEAVQALERLFARW